MTHILWIISGTFFWKFWRRDPRTETSPFRWPQKWIKVDSINGNVWFVWINLDFCLFCLLWWMPKAKITDNLTDYRIHAILYTFQVWFDRNQGQILIFDKLLRKIIWSRQPTHFKSLILRRPTLDRWSEISMCQR